MTGYRTYIAAALVAVFGALSTLDWVHIFNDPKAGMALVANAILMAVLRSITTTPPGTR